MTLLWVENGGDKKFDKVTETFQKYCNTFCTSGTCFGISSRRKLSLWTYTLFVLN